MLAELSRREKTANIKPDPDLDIYMKVRMHLEKRKLEKKLMLNFCLNFYLPWCKIAAKSTLLLSILQAASLEGQETSVITDYILKVPISLSDLKGMHHKQKYKKGYNICY